MKVLHLSRDHPPRTTGGISVAVGGLVEAQSQHGMECAVLSFDAWRPRRRSAAAAAAFEGVGPVRVWRVHDDSQARAAAADAATWRPDIVHVHHGMLWPYAELFLRLGVTACTCVTTHVLQREMSRLRGLDQPTMSEQGQDAAIASADAVIAPSRAALAILQADYPNRADRMHMIGFGAEPRPRPQRSNQNGPMLLYGGRFSDVKGSAELVTASARLLEAHPSVRVVIAGGNPESPKSERRWLRRFAEAVAPEHADRLELRGWVDAPTLSALRRSAELALVPSWFESFGMAALEALAHGVPVVGSTGGALPEVVDHGRSGLLSPPRDVRGLVDHALFLLEHREMVGTMRTRAVEAVTSRFRWPDVAVRHLETYSSL